ncbi:unnamed protein product, partial [marine sediment metagenome]
EDLWLDLLHFNHLDLNVNILLANTYLQENYLYILSHRKKYQKILTKVMINGPHELMSHSRIFEYLAYIGKAYLYDRKPFTLDEILANTKDQILLQYKNVLIVGIISPGKVNSQKDFPLMIALDLMQIEISEILLDVIMDMSPDKIKKFISHINDGGNTTLINAANAEAVNIVKRLLKLSPEITLPEHKNNAGYTALSTAIVRGSKDIIEMLLPLSHN